MGQPQNINSLDRLNSGFAVSLAGTFKLLGGAVATAIYTAILNTKFDATLPPLMTTAIINSGVSFSETLLSDLEAAAQLNTVQAYTSVDGVSSALAIAAKEAMTKAYEQSFRLVYLCTIGFGCLALLAAASIKETDRAKWNNDRAVILKNEKREGTNKV